MWLMDLVSIILLLEVNFKGIGKKIKDMAKVNKHGLMDLFIKEITKRTKNQEMESFSTITVTFIQDK